MKINFILLVAFFSLCTSILPSQAMNDDYFEIQRQKQAAIQRIVDADNKSPPSDYQKSNEEIKKVTEQYDAKVDDLIQKNKK